MTIVTPGEEDYFNEWKGTEWRGTDWELDKNSAVKLALHPIFSTGRLLALSYLLTDGHEIGALEGVPGWEIERKDKGQLGQHPYHSDWPETAHFRAHVDPDCFNEAYIRRNPSDLDMAKSDHFLVTAKTYGTLKHDAPHLFRYYR